MLTHLLNAIYVIEGSGIFYSVASGLTRQDSDDQGGSYSAIWGDGTFIYVGGTALRSYSVSGGLLSIEDIKTDGGSQYLGIWGDGNFIYAACQADGLRSYSVDGVGDLTLVDTDDQGSYNDVWSDGTFIFVADRNAGIKSYSVDGSGNLTYIPPGDDQGGFYWGVWGDGNYIYAANSTGLMSYSVDGAGALTYIGIAAGDEYCTKVHGDGTFIYTVGGSNGLSSYSVDGSGNLTLLNTHVPDGDYRDVWSNSSYIYVADYNSGIISYEVDGSGILKALYTAQVYFQWPQGVWGDSTWIYTGSVISGIRTDRKVAMDDGFIDVGGTLSRTGELIGCGYVGANLTECYIRLPAVTIPQGSTIVTAYLHLTQYSGSEESTVHIYAEDSDDAVAPTDATEFNALTLTTAYGTWVTADLLYGIGDEIDSADFAAVIQEIVDRGSWASGNAMMLVLKDGGGVAGNNYWYSFDSSGGIHKPELHITWTE